MPLTYDAFENYSTVPTDIPLSNSKIGGTQRGIGKDFILCDYKLLKALFDFAQAERKRNARLGKQTRVQVEKFYQKNLTSQRFLPVFDEDLSSNISLEVRLERPPKFDPDQVKLIPGGIPEELQNELSLPEPRNRPARKIARNQASLATLRNPVLSNNRTMEHYLIFPELGGKLGSKQAQPGKLRIDALASYSKDEKLLIEFKDNRALHGPKGALEVYKQAQGYKNLLEQVKGWNVETLIVAADISPSAALLLEKLNQNYLIVQPPKQKADRIKRTLGYINFKYQQYGLMPEEIEKQILREPIAEQVGVVPSIDVLPNFSAPSQFKVERKLNLFFKSKYVKEAIVPRGITDEILNICRKYNQPCLKIINSFEYEKQELERKLSDFAYILGQVEDKLNKKFDISYH